MNLSYIQDNLGHLWLCRIHDHLENAREEAAKNNLSFTASLDQLFAQEVASK